MWSTLGTGTGSAPPAPLIAGPMTNADRENIAATISSPMAGHAGSAVTYRSACSCQTRSAESAQL